MAINWFPGHMHKARKEIKQVMPKMDLIIEVLDARAPFSSENPLVPAELQRNVLAAGGYGIDGQAASEPAAPTGNLDE